MARLLDREKGVENGGSHVLKTLAITLECNKGGERMDVFLASYLSGLTRNAAQKLIEAGHVTLNDVPVRIG